MATAEDRDHSGANSGAAGGGGFGTAAPPPATLLDTVTATVAATLAANPAAARKVEAEAEAEAQAGVKEVIGAAAGATANPAAAQLDAPLAQAAVVSVVVSSGGDPVQLDRCLDALTRQDLHAAYEIIVVDSGADGDAGDNVSAEADGGTGLPRSPADTAASGAGAGRSAVGSAPASVQSASGIARMVASWQARSAGRRLQLRYVAAHGTSGGAASRNRGWHAAGAPIVAFTADDTVASVDWLRQGLAAFGNYGNGGDGGNGGNGGEVGDGPAASSASARAALPVDAVFGHVVPTVPKHPSEFQLNVLLRESGDFVARNWFCRRSVLDKLGGFDERFSSGDDNDGATRGDGDDMYFRLLESGARWQRAGAAIVVHPVPAAGWGASLSQLRRLSDEALLYKKHPQLYREKIRRPPDWHDVAVVAALLLAIAGIAFGQELLTVAAGGTWLVLTAMLSIRRLHDTAKTASQVAEVLLTSPLLPPLALFWRLVGAIRYRVGFA